jgi:hypothetical protein
MSLPAPRPLDVPTETLEDEVAALAAQLAAATGRMMPLLAELDRRAAWAAGGHRSLAHWLAWRTGMSLATARDHVRVALALRDLPRTAQALAAGQLSYSKAQAITRVARTETEEALVEMARAGTAAQLERIVQGVHRADADEKPAAARVAERRGLTLRHDEDGMLVISGRLAPDEGALFLRALEAARRELWDGKPAACAEAERADALVLMADRSLSEGAHPRSGGDRNLVVVHADAEVLAGRADGRADLPAGASRRLACDASVVTVAHGPEGEMTAGRKTRVVPAALRRALAARYHGHCAFPGCNCRVTDVHHVVHWAAGGPTVEANTLLLCRRCHRLVHEGGFRVELDRGRPRFFRPDGEEMPSAPPLPAVDLAVTADPYCPPGPSPDPYSLTPTWDGSPVDYDWAVAAVHSRGHGASASGARLAPPAPS